jgi:hypothetical protein
VALNPELRIETGWGFIPNSTDTAPATNGASIVRGPLVFALHPKESRTVVKNYSNNLPYRPKAVDYQISTNDSWNYALVLTEHAPTTTNPKGTTTHVVHRHGGARAAVDGADISKPNPNPKDNGNAPMFDPTPSAGWSSSFPFDDSGEYPFSIKVQARQLHAWGYWEGSKITAVPPASPVQCSAGSTDCGELTELKLVPFGSTNIRVSVFPWLKD